MPAADLIIISVLPQIGKVSHYFLFQERFSLVYYMGCFHQQKLQPCVICGMLMIDFIVHSEYLLKLYLRCHSVFLGIADRQPFKYGLWTQHLCVLQSKAAGEKANEMEAYFRW